MTEIIDLLPDSLLSLDIICSLDTQQERQTFSDQSKAMIDTSKRSYERRYTSNVYNHCGKA